MRRTLLTIIILFILVLMPSTAFAQGMMGTQSAVSSNSRTAREEQEGKAIWEKLQAKQLECTNLTDDNFEVLGEYFMGQMAGGSHEAMNNMMVRMIGEEGEKQMHIAMGKRNSGCDTSLKFPQSGTGFMPMMWMMGGGENPMMGTGWGNMMGGWGGFGFFGFLTGIFWVVILVDLILLGIWLWKKIKKEK